MSVVPSLFVAFAVADAYASEVRTVVFVQEQEESKTAVVMRFVAVALPWEVLFDVCVIAAVECQWVLVSLCTSSWHCDVPTVKPLPLQRAEYMDTAVS